MGITDMHTDVDVPCNVSEGLHVWTQPVAVMHG